MNLRYFNDEEFRKAVPSCSLSDMDQEFMLRIDACRAYADIPFVVNSAFRSVDYEKKKGRTGESMHTKGKALDIRCRTNAERYRILDALIVFGFHRIGIGSNFIHVDCGYPSSEPIIWTY